jgi:His/Glu/Gln/Arg/opine family amino acid ABC transporter permease subunit
MRFITNIFNAISNNLISGGAYYQIAKGVLVTAAVTVTAWIFAALLGCAISYLMCFEKKIVSSIGRGLCFVFRSVPVILIMWLFYYCIFGGGSGKAVIVAGIAIGFWGGGHLSEIVERTVNKMREEVSETIAARMERVYFSAVVPQALEDSLWDLKRLAVHILQWSAVSGYIAVNDLTEVMYGIGHRTMYPFFSIFFAAILYLIATLLIEWLFKFLEKLIKKEEESEE